MGPTEIDAASLLRLSPELRLLIYEQVFRSEQWEEQRRAKRSLPSAPDSYVHSHGDFRNAVYPRCQLLGNGIKIRVMGFYGLESQRAGVKLLHRAAILRTCRTIYHEAVDVLYANTPFAIGVTQYTDGYDRVKLNFEPDSAFFLRRIERLSLSIAMHDSQTAFLQKKHTLVLMQAICKEREPSTTSVELIEPHPKRSVEVWLRNRYLLCHCYIPGDGLQFVPSGQDFAHGLVIDIKDIMEGSVHSSQTYPSPGTAASHVGQ